MGRKKIIRPQADEATIKRVKQMIREYPLRSREMAMYEKSRAKVLRYITVGGEITREELADAQKYKNYSMPQREKNALLRYFEDREVVYLLKSGMDTMPEGRYRDITSDKIFAGLTNEQIMVKYGVCYRTIKRAIHEAKLYIAAYVEQYIDWKKSVLIFEK